MKLKLTRDIETGIIAHQSAARGCFIRVWAKQLQPSGRWWGREYRRFCGPDAGGKRFVPGKIQMVRVSSNPELWACSMAGQNLYGSKKRYTDYDALALCLSKASPRNPWTWN